MSLPPPSTASSGKDACGPGPTPGRPGFHTFTVQGSPFVVESHYVLERVVGSGAYGTVVSGVDVRTETRVAVKKVPNTYHDLTDALRVVRAEQPRLLLVNGPGTCIPVCAAAVLLRALGLAPRDLTIVFVESVCRVDSLSVSGHAAYWLGLADVVAVQWRQLKERFPGVHYVGLQV
jgi:beta-1,4-N-acetylglucosaminyltransferase